MFTRVLGPSIVERQSATEALHNCVFMGDSIYLVQAVPNRSEIIALLALGVGLISLSKYKIHV